MFVRNLPNFIAIAFIALLIGCAISFVMLGFWPHSETAIYGVAIALEVGSQVFGEFIRDAVPEGGPAAFVALHMLTFTAIWSFVIFVLLLAFLWFRSWQLPRAPHS